jgi:preprotein translocase subunit YajC
MDSTNLTALFAMGPTPGPPGTAPNAQGEMLKLVLMLVMFGVVFYLIAIRPQQKRAKEQANMLKSVKTGDKILTTGGVIGTVVTVKEKTLSIRSADSKMEITKSAIAEITERSGESSETKSPSS